MKSGSKGSSKEQKKIESMSLDQMNDEVQRCLNGVSNAGTTVAKKAYFKLLVWVEQIRENKYEIEAPQRDFKKLKR